MASIIRKTLGSYSILLRRSEVQDPSRDRRRQSFKSTPGRFETPSSAGSLGLHIVIVDPSHPAASRPLIREDPVSGIPLAWSQWR